VTCSADKRITIFKNFLTLPKEAKDKRLFFDLPVLYNFQKRITWIVLKIVVPHRESGFAFNVLESPISFVMSKP
jgi:hypothetical protein